MRVFVRSYGCSTNLFEGAVLAGCLARAGHKLVDSVSTAEVVVLNTCAVKGPTENRMIEIAKRIPPKKKLIVAGCLPLINFERLQREVPFAGTIGPRAGERIVGVVRRVSTGERVVSLKTIGLPDLNLPRVQSNPVTSTVPLSNGCLGSCAYCCVVFARGRLRSYSVRDIVERVKQDLASGFREIWITSQDTACYGKDIGTSLPELLYALLDINREFRIRVGMMTPNNAGDILEELIEAFQDIRVFKFIHLPVQSGDDDVLKRMRRFYSVNDFRMLVSRFRGRFPDITLATDVICGFPGESEEAFERTLRLIKDVKPDIVNVSKFFARPNTAATMMQKDFVPFSEIKRRSVQASGLANRLAFENNLRWLGWTGEILVDEVGKLPGSWIGRNFAYKPIVVNRASILMGNVKNVRIVKAFPTYLAGEVF